MNTAKFLGKSAKKEGEHRRGEEQATCHALFWVESEPQHV